MFVEVDLTKHMLDKYMTDERVFHIQYENLENIYFRCGFYDHKIDSCPALRQTNVIDPSTETSTILDET
ncbi:hypothetical protein LINPERHAP2_LOCUS14284 [Linum perenne]